MPGALDMWRYINNNDHFEKYATSTMMQKGNSKIAGKEFAQNSFSGGISDLKQRDMMMVRATKTLTGVKDPITRYSLSFILRVALLVPTA